MRRLLNKILIPKGYEIQKIGRVVYLLEQLSKKKSEITLIQVGANDGISFDNIYPFFVSNNTRGLVIEPLPDFFDRLKLNYSAYPKITPLRLAIHPSKESISIYRLKFDSLQKYPHWANGIASFDKQHLIKLNIKDEDIEADNVPCSSLMSLIDQYKLENLDYLQIDTEGFDDEIIKMIDFSKCRPKIIKFEVHHLSVERKNLILKLLTEQRYKIIDERRDMLAVLN